MQATYEVEIGREVNTNDNTILYADNDAELLEIANRELGNWITVCDDGRHNSPQNGWACGTGRELAELLGRLKGIGRTLDGREIS